MNAVIDALGFKQVVLSGYDWSTSIALYMAAVSPKRVSKVVAFHPSMANTKEHQALLAKIQCPVLI